GATGQVERSATLISHEDSKILLDYGVQLKRPPLFPLHVSPKELSAMTLSHAHLDHSGASPFLYVSGMMNAYMTSATLDLIDLLIRDFLKISGPDLPYEFIDFQTLRGKTTTVEYHQRIEVPSSPFTLELLDAGHVPGSSQIMVDVGSTRVLYTGDLNSYETHLQPAAETDYGDVDVVITESTYAGVIHPERERHEKDFVDKVGEVLEVGGIALIPTFALGRSQEILLILLERGFEGDIYMDGMALTATDILMQHPGFLKDASKLEKAMERVNKIFQWRQRRKVIKDPCAIISPAGMMGGGSSVFYMKKLRDDPRNAIFVVGFQSPGTPGRTLVEEKKAYIEGRRQRVKSEVYRYSFSSHIDQKGFKRLLKNIKGQPIVFVVHGNLPNQETLAELASKEIGLEAYAPRFGDEFEVSDSGVVRRG
nr:MBL fold metallo-hydrolase [Nitrososphaeria archaeon]NIN53477.1 MBL fold metallo-hydrolase [Nitrososphaeria archaeon]NIQ33994.1 MBL fold metallo-hydrolase [Nitrososphaeria archaeon]